MASTRRRTPAVTPVRLLLAAALALVGCDDTGRAPAPGAPGAAPDRPRITWLLAVSNMRPAFEDVVRRFGEVRPDVDVRLMWVPATQYQAKFKTLVAAGQAPDLVVCGDVWVAYMLPFLLDLTPLVERDAAELDLPDFYPQVLEACRHRGRYYFLANRMNVSMLYYNRRLFDAAGVAYPTAAWTWDDYVQAGVKLTGEGQWGSDIVAGWWGEWLIYVRQAGGDLFDAGVTRCTLDDPRAVAGLRFYYDKVYTQRFSPPPGRGPHNGFAGGRVAMLYGGHLETWRTYNATLGDGWDVQVLPAGPAGRAGGEMAVESYGISRDCREVEAAWALIKLIVSRESIRKLADAGVMPVRRSVSDEVLLRSARKAGPANVAAVFQQVKDARPIPRSPNYIELALEIIQPEIDRMLLNEQSPEETARRATEAANRFLAVLGQRRQERPQNGGDAP
jgi:multiple sugar transport system substrate-binding protein